MTMRTHFDEQFLCSIANKPVTIKGVAITLKGSSSGAAAIPLLVQRSVHFCSGAPACGRRLLDADCPYPKPET
jgi:hypothetical protein